MVHDRCPLRDCIGYADIVYPEDHGRSMKTSLATPFFTTPLIVVIDAVETAVPDRAFQESPFMTSLPVGHFNDFESLIPFSPTWSEIYDHGFLILLLLPRILQVCLHRSVTLLYMIVDTDSCTLGDAIAYIYSA